MQHAPELFAALLTYKDITDDVSAGRSLYKAQAYAAARILERLQQVQAAGGVAFVLADELFTGTNPQEGEAAVYSFLQYVGQHFGASGHCLLIDSLHFERPTLLGKQPGFVNKHVRIERDAHGFRYTYQLADGIAPQDARIGIDILAQEGFPATLVASGRDVLQHPDKYQVPG